MMRWLNKSSLGLPKEAFQKKGRLLVLAVAMLMAVLLAALAYVVLTAESGSNSGEKNTYLLLADFSKNKAIIQDASGKAVASADFPYPSSYISQHSTTPGGAVLLSVGGGSNHETFFFVNRQQKTELTKEVNQALASAVMLDGKHNIVFINEVTALYVACPADQTCKLSRLDINSGKNEVLSDSGVAGSLFNPVYLLAASSDNKSVYLRVSGANKYGSDKSALYKFDLVTKKTSSTTKLPFDAGQNLSLSPDEKKLVYKTGGLGKELELKLIDLATSKETKVTWNKSEIANLPAAFVWSPDGQTILFLSSASIARPTAAADNPQKLAILDLKDNKITELQTVTKTYLNSIVYYSWLDNDTIIYEQATAKENDFGGAKKEVYKQDIASKTVSKIEMTANLQEVLFW